MFWPPKLWHSFHEWCDCWGGPSGTDSRAWWGSHDLLPGYPYGHCQHWMDISTDPMGHFIFLFLQDDPNFTHTSVCGIGSKTLYIPYQACSICCLQHTKVPCKVLSLSLLQHYLWRGNTLSDVWEFCVNWNIDQRQRCESWELQTIFLALFTSSDSQLLTFYMGCTLPLPAHTFTNPSATLFRGCWNNSRFVLMSWEVQRYKWNLGFPRALLKTQPKAYKG